MDHEVIQEFERIQSWNINKFIYTMFTEIALTAYGENQVSWYVGSVAGRSGGG